jgi:cold shock CspA family protein
VQATVRSFDAETHSGTVLLDDGLEVPYGAAAFVHSGLRLLRVGQRVRIALAPDGAAVSALTLATFPAAPTDSVQ